MRQRIANVRDLLERRELDGLLISSNANRYYLSGFSGSHGWLLITLDSNFLATDFRYWEQAQHEAPDYTLCRLRTAVPWAELAAASEGKHIGFEANHVSVQEHLEMQDVDGVDWVPLDNPVASLRTSKDDEETQLIRQAARIADEVMARVPTMVRIGQTERDLAWELEKALREDGADGLAFPVIAASGPNAALPHHRPCDRNLQEGDVLIVDLGAKVNGYNSDLTRTFFVGETLAPTFVAIFDLVQAAQTAALQQIAPDADPRQVDRAARSLIEEAGHGEHFGHGLGHGVGLEVHEEPRLSPLSKTAELVVGAVTTVEPGVYVPGWGGVRIEDLVLVTETGHEILSKCKYDPLIVPQ